MEKKNEKAGIQLMSRQVTKTNYNSCIRSIVEIIL